MTAPDRGRVMVVDDQPANLTLMEEMLRNEGYSVTLFPRGRLALAAASQQPPDLILLDVNMPEMDGFEVCARLKADGKLASIPVIFLTALTETDNKLRAFKAGCVDYITKPFQYEEVQVRVETQMALERSREAERQLLEQTLNGAVRTLTGLVHLIGPALGARADAIRGIVLHLISRMNLADSWQYDLASILCLTGCVALPADVFERAYGLAPRPGDEEMFRAHPENGARLLANIPRLGNVAEMIRRQQTAGGNALPEDTSELGACLLRLAVELDRRMYTGVSFEKALNQLRAIPPGFPAIMMEAMRDYSPAIAEFELKCLHVRDLRVSMIADEDIVTSDGSFKLLRKGAVLTATALERIRNFDKTRGTNQPIRVRVPRAGRIQETPKNGTRP